MFRMIMAAAIATTLAAGVAAAQSTNDAVAPEPSGVPEQPTAAGDARPGHTVARPEATDLMASELMGLDVYNRRDEVVGKIDDILFNPDLTPRAVVVGVGGLFGVSKRKVVVDPQTLHITPAGDGQDVLRAQLDTDSKDLQDAPQFKG